MKNLIVSVIIPTYNRAEMVKRAIKSVFKQTYKNFEVIIVDDGSTDNTEAVIQKMRERNRRTRYIKHKKNRGGTAARNTGIKNARGKYIAFLDSDDEWLPEKLEKQMKMLQGSPTEVGVNYSALWKIRGNKRFYFPSPKIFACDGYIHNIILEGNSYIGTPCSLVKKQVFEKVGMFDEKLAACQETELWIRVSKYYHFQFIDEPLVISYTEKDSVSANYDARSKAYKIIFKKHYRKFEANKKAKANILFNIGNNLCQIGKTKEGKKYLEMSVKLMPQKLEYLIAFILASMGKYIYRGASRIKKRLIGWS